MSSTESFFMQQSTDVPRDRYGRYLLPDETGTETGWTRATTFAATLAESYGLRIWEQRQVVWGLSRRPDLLTLASTIVGPEDKKALGAIVDSAHEAGGTQAKANRGSAIHKAIEQVEKGALSFESVPDELKNDVRGYFSELARWGITILPEYIERTVIVACYKVAGTFDNIVRCPDGKLRILDKKTGNLDYAEIEFAVQMALYANADALRNYGTNTYEPMPEVAKDYAIIAHIEPGTGRTELHRANIGWGWAWARTCAEVQDIRKTKHVLTPYVGDAPRTLLASDVGVLTSVQPSPPVAAPPRPIELLNVAPAAVAAQAIQGFAAAHTMSPCPTEFVFDWDTLQDDDDEEQRQVLGPSPFAVTPGASAVDSATAPGGPSVPDHPSSGGVGSPAAPNSAAPPASSPIPTTSTPSPKPGSAPMSTPTATGEQATIERVTLTADEAESVAEALVKGAKGKAKLQSIAKDVHTAACARDADAPSLKLNQHQIKLAREIVAMACKYGIPLPTFEKPRRSAAPTEAESAEDTALTRSLKYVRSMPTVQGLVEYQANLGEAWTDEHQEAARVRVEQLKAAQANGETPLTPAQIIAGATSPASLQQAWRVATTNGANVPGWTPELESAAQEKSAAMGVPRGD